MCSRCRHSLSPAIRISSHNLSGQPRELMQIESRVMPCSGFLFLLGCFRNRFKKCVRGGGERRSRIGASATVTVDIHSRLVPRQVPQFVEDINSGVDRTAPVT